MPVVQVPRQFLPADPDQWPICTPSAISSSQQLHCNAADRPWHVKRSQLHTLRPPELSLRYLSQHQLYTYHDGSYAMHPKKLSECKGGLLSEVGLVGQDGACIRKKQSLLSATDSQ